ncbi:hypothetical protein NM688_g149 [Phlebia brevispora]|uniref:Uncharacterized protein n=1 Tax=Phlebia brevispora TaxID=194682 RepID=A0ACC1TEV1_9APHY|nr:hypothetical protein NM688_g149 [Phlebia brevispora]
MSSVQLTIVASGKPTGNLQTYTFTRVQEYGSKEVESDETLQFTQTELLHNGRSLVFKGTLSSGRKKQLNVVCKMIRDTETDNRAKYLVREATAYSKNLEELQGICVPKFYGLYVGDIYEEPASCIILEDCGVPLKEQFTEYSLELRIKFVQALMAIHKRGVWHRDLWPSNVVVDSLTDPTRVNIIDFDVARTNHQCPFEAMKIRLFALPAEIRCLEIYQAILGLKLITAPFVKYFGTTVWMSTFVGAEGLVQKGPQSIGYTHEQLLQIANNVLSDYFDQYGENADYVLGKKEWIIEPVA